MRVVTAAEMRALDRRAVENFGIPGVVLMENAGRAVMEAVKRRCGSLYGKRADVYCGAGNNGGDGFVVARLLHLSGARVSVILIAARDALKGDARVHFHVLETLGIRIVEAPQGPENEASNAEIIIDALLGTGIQNALRSPYARAITRINGAGRPVISVDIPSGVNADTGETHGEAVRATETVTFGYPKLGHYLFPGAHCVGSLFVDRIGFDWDILSEDARIELVVLPGIPSISEGRAWGEDYVRRFADTRLLKPRPPNSNKGDFGHVVVVAGSAGMAGAPAMVARSAQRSGAGLVTVLSPKGVQPTIASKLDEQMTLPLPEEEGAVSLLAFDKIQEYANRATVLCVGPGLTTAEGATALVHRIIAEIEKPLVLDADGLNALAKNPTCAAKRKGNMRTPLILTPHPGEAARLLATSIQAVEADRIASVRELAKRYGAIVVLKGRYTVVADPEGRVRINSTGNPGMATGGMGDTLTGIVGALLSQDLAPARDITDEEAYRSAIADPLDVVALAVALHGFAGDLAAHSIGETGLLAGDVIDCLPAALRRLKGER